MAAVNDLTDPLPSGAHLFRERVVASGPRVALRHKVGAQWQALTWNECDRAAREIGAGLLGLGVRKGDRVVILAETRVEWVLCELGTVMIGAVCVPIYPTSTAEQCAYIVADAGAKVAIAQDPGQVEKLLAAQHRDQFGSLRVVYLDAAAERAPMRMEDVVPADARERVQSLLDLREQGRARMRADGLALDQATDALGPDDVWSIVYTSGTTGPPKGVVLTHANLCVECAALGSLLPIDQDDEQLIFLPLAHIFGRVLAWMNVQRGMTLTFAEGITELAANLREVGPTFMGAVPRVYEKVYNKVQAGAAQAGGAKKAIFDFAMASGRRASALRQKGESIPPLLALKLAIADRLVFRKLRAAFGGRIRFFISGGAPLAREIAEFFHAAGILICEGWGLTETTAATCVNRPDRFRFGTVGPAVPEIELSIAADGEILVRGKPVMREYYKRPEATAEAIDGQGWFHTGDIGVIEDGFLRITDRKKDLIVTSVGKNIAPQNIENALKASCPLISQVMVHGDQRPYVVALVTLAEDAVVPWAKQRGIAFADPSDLANDAEVRAAVQAAVDQLNTRLANYESIKRFHVAARDFTQESGELTPTLKVKRKFTTQKFAAELAAMYDGPAPATGPS